MSGNTVPKKVELELDENEERTTDLRLKDQILKRCRSELDMDFKVKL
jgi:hypothetical protein